MKEEGKKEIKNWKQNKKVKLSGKQKDRKEKNKKRREKYTSEHIPPQYMSSSNVLKYNGFTKMSSESK